MAADRKRRRPKQASETGQQTEDEVSVEQNRWLAVIARALAYLCLQSSSLKDEKYLKTKATFLEGLGLTRADCANLLGTTAESLRVISYRQPRRRKTKGAQPKKKASKR